MWAPPDPRLPPLRLWPFSNCSLINTQTSDWSPEISRTERPRAERASREEETPPAAAAATIPAGPNGAPERRRARVAAVPLAAPQERHAHLAAPPVGGAAALLLARLHLPHLLHRPRRALQVLQHHRLPQRAGPGRARRAADPALRGQVLHQVPLLRLPLERRRQRTRQGTRRRHPKEQPRPAHPRGQGPDSSLLCFRVSFVSYRSGLGKIVFLSRFLPWNWCVISRAELGWPVWAAGNVVLARLV
jgi:hypothetical protein